MCTIVYSKPHLTFCSPWLLFGNGTPRDPAGRQGPTGFPLKWTPWVKLLLKSLEDPAENMVQGGLRW